MKRTAFSMLELVIIIVVIGILSVNLIPTMERDQAGEAAYQIARHLRLTQHYALINNRFDGTADWDKEMWQMAFTHSNLNGGDCYDVFSDSNRLGNASINEAAIDPMTRKPLFSNNCNQDNDYNSDVLLWKQYGVTSISFSTGCGNNQYIAFDNLGRPYSQIGSLMTADCDITLNTNDGHSAVVTVYEETGYVKVAQIDATSL